MEWDSLLTSLIGSSPATGMCLFAIRVLWLRLKERDSELADLNQARIEDLRQILELSDSGARSSKRE